MKEVLVAAILAFTLGAGVQSWAHEGHNAPGSVQAQHGGTVKATKSFYIELVQEGNTLKLYPMGHDFKPVPLKEVQIEATAQLPKAKAKTSVKFSEHAVDDATQSHYMGSFDAKGAHRYTLVVTAQYRGKKEAVTFQVEPKN